MRNFKSNPVINIRYLEAVAGTKFVLTEFANLVHSQFDQDDHIDNALMGELELMENLTDIVRKVCTDTVINTTTFSSGGIMDVMGPSVYLLKLLMRQFSFPCLKQASEKYLWIVPEGLRASNLVSLMPTQKTCAVTFIRVKGRNV